MSKEAQVQEKAQKTLQLLGIANLVLSTIYLIDTRLGLAVSVAANSAALYFFHELGKSRRPGSNAVNKINTFFSSQTNLESAEVQNTFRNVINGGAAIHDELTAMVRP